MKNKKHPPPPTSPTLNNDYLGEEIKLGIDRANKTRRTGTNNEGIKRCDASKDWAALLLLRIVTDWIRHSVTPPRRGTVVSRITRIAKRIRDSAEDAGKKIRTN